MKTLSELILLLAAFYGIGRLATDIADAVFTLHFALSRRPKPKPATPREIFASEENPFHDTLPSPSRERGRG